MTARRRFLAAVAALVPGAVVASHFGDSEIGHPGRPLMQLTSDDEAMLRWVEERQIPGAAGNMRVYFRLELSTGECVEAQDCRLELVLRTLRLWFDWIEERGVVGVRELTIRPLEP